jgi:hypothetical protein
VGPDPERGHSTTFSWRLILTRAAKAILLLFAAALLTDLIYFGLAPLREPSRLMRPPVISGPPAHEQLSMTGWAKSQLAGEPAPERRLTVSASPSATVFNFELIANKKHPLGEWARSILKAADVAELCEAAFGRIVINGRPLRPEDFAPLTWTLNGRDALLHIEAVASVRAEKNVLVEVATVESRRPIGILKLILDHVRLTTFYPAPDEASKDQVVIKGGTAEETAPVQFGLTMADESGALLPQRNELSRQNYLLRLGRTLDLTFLGTTFYSVVAVVPLLIFLGLIAYWRRRNLIDAQGVAWAEYCGHATVVTAGLLVVHFTPYLLAALGEVFGRFFSPYSSTLLHYTGTYFSFQGPWRMAPALIGIVVPALLFQWAREGVAPRTRAIGRVAIVFQLVLILAFAGSIAGYLIRGTTAGEWVPLNWMIGLFLSSIGAICLDFVLRRLYRQCATPVNGAAVVLAVLFILAAAVLEIAVSRDRQPWQGVTFVVLTVALGSILVLAMARLAISRLLHRANPVPPQWRWPIVAGAVLLALPTGEIFQGLDDLRASTALLNFAFQINQVLFFIWVAAAILLLYEGGKTAPALTEPTRFVGILVASAIFFAATARWLFIPVRFLGGLWLLLSIVRPAGFWNEIKDAYATVVANRALLLGRLIDLKTAENAHSSFRKELAEKLSSAKISVERYDELLAEATSRISELRERANIATGASRGYALSFGPYASAWRNALHGTWWALVLASPWIGLFVRDYLHEPLSAGSYPLWNFTGDFLSVVTNWGAIGFFLGYFYPYIRGGNGLQKGLTLFAGIVLPALPLMALFNTSSQDWQPAFFWFLQVFIVCTLLGLVAFDYPIVRKSGYDWQMVFDLHGLTRIGISLSSILAAIGVAITTLLSSQAASLVSNALQWIAPTRVVEAKAPPATAATPQPTATPSPTPTPTPAQR